MVMGICGGFQMLGNRLRDPEHTESAVPETAGLGLLDLDVVFEREKQTVQATGTVECASGWPAAFNGLTVEGYEIHAGRNLPGEGAVSWLKTGGKTDGIMNAEGNVLGTYLHGLFDDGKLFTAVAGRIRELRGDEALDSAPVSMEAFREREFDRIAAIVRSSVNMDAIYRIMNGEDVPCGSGLPL
jgi:adenosylcobyric acid synthase